MRDRRSHGGDRDGAERSTPEEIVAKLRQVEVLAAQGKAVAEAVRAIGVTEATFYRWRAGFGGLKLDQVKRLKQLEAENGRLRKAVADLTLEKLILKGAGHCPAPAGNYFSIRGAWRNSSFAAPDLGERGDGGSCGALASLRGRRSGRRHVGIRGGGRSHLSRAVGIAAAPVSPVSPVPPSPQGPLPPAREEP
jgi:putative transposase